VNRVTLLGFVGRDPKSSTTSQGNSSCSFSLATEKKWKDKSGQLQAKTEWHFCQVYGKLAEACNQYVRKGSRIYLEGEISTFTAKDKEGVEREVKSIVVNQIEFLTPKEKGPTDLDQTLDRLPPPKSGHSAKETWPDQHFAPDPYGMDQLPF
jgi:single-strand DNA-binding protein